MSDVKDTGKNIAEGIARQIGEIKDNEVEKFLEILINSRTVYVTGAGRTGLMTKSFAMRLMHLDFNVYVVGETITPATKPGDLLIAMSGSGKTSSVLVLAKTAKKRGVKIAAITSFTDSPLAKLADCVVQVGGRRLEGDTNETYMSKQLMGEHAPLTPLGTLFELTLAVFLDSVIHELMKIFKKDEKELKKRHSVLE